MASLLDKVKAAVGNGTLMPDNYSNAIFASRNDPEVIAYLESITPSSPVALFDTAAKVSGYPDLRDRTSPLGSIARVATGETPILNPYLFNGVTRPTSEATKQVDMQNRNATIQKQNQAMVNAAKSLIPEFSGRGLPPASSGIYSGVSLDNPSPNLPQIPDRFTKTDGRGLPTSNIYSGVSFDNPSPDLTSLFSLIQGRAPAMVGSGIQSTVAPDASSPEVSTGRRGGRGSTPVDSTLIVGGSSRGDRESTGFVNPLESLSRPTSPKDQGGRGTGARNVSPPVVKEEKKTEDLTEKTEDLTPEAKTFNTAATVVSPSAPEKKQDWFNAVNDRIDLMAMGAAMLAGSGQRGATTMSRLGEGLQAGLASRAAQAKAAEDKQYTDALLVLKAMEQRRLSAKDRAAGLQDPLTVREAIDGMSSEFIVAGANPDNTKMISTYFQTRPALKSGIDSLAPNQRGVFMSEFVSKGQGWVGDKIEPNNINKAYNDALVIARKVKPTGVN